MCWKTQPLYFLHFLWLQKCWNILTLKKAWWHHYLRLFLLFSCVANTEDDIARHREQYLTGKKKEKKTIWKIRIENEKHDALKPESNTYCIPPLKQTQHTEKTGQAKKKSVKTEPAWFKMHCSKWKQALRLWKKMSASLFFTLSKPSSFIIIIAGSSPSWTYKKINIKKWKTWFCFPADCLRRSQYYTAHRAKPFYQIGTPFPRQPTGIGIND